MKTIREYINLIESAQNGDYEYPYDMSARDKGRYDAMQGREYRNPYSPFGTESDHNNSIEYSAAYDSVKDEGLSEEQDTASAEILLQRYKLLVTAVRNAIDEREYRTNTAHLDRVRDTLINHYGIDPDKLDENGGLQEYTVRVVDEENSGYTVKVQAASEQQALHKAIVKVRNQYDAYPEHARIIRQDVEEDQATARMGLMSAVGSNDNNPAEQRRAMAQQAVERLAAKK